MGILKGYLIMAATQMPVLPYGHGLRPDTHRFKEVSRPTTIQKPQDKPIKLQNQTRIIRKGKSIIPEVMPPNRK